MEIECEMVMMAAWWERGTEGSGRGERQWRQQGDAVCVGGGGEEESC